MSEVKRYWRNDGSPSGMREDPIGAWVKASDYDALAARVATLREYVWHKPECHFLQETLPCTCGLDACLADADGGKP